MNISPRIYLPALLAIIIAGAIGGLFLWQIQHSISTIEIGFRRNPGTSMLNALMPGNTQQFDSATQSQALVKLRQGEVFELKGEWKLAEEHYTESVQSGGGAPALKKLASIQLKRREYAAARDTINRLKDENSDSDDVLLLEGTLELRSGNLGTAEAVFRRRTQAPQSAYGLGLVAITQSKWEVAKKSFELAAQGTDPAIRSFSNVILQAFNEFALFPSGQPVHLQTLVARALAEVNECETALPLVISASETEPDYRDAWIVKGYCEFSTERSKESLASLERAYKLDPEKPETQYFLARTYAALGDPQNAVTFLQYAVLNGFKPERDARELLAEYARELGNTALALEQYKVLAQGKDAIRDDISRYVDLASGTNEHALDALALAKAALVKWPDDARMLAVAAKAALAAGLPDDASKYVEKALKIDAKNVEALAVAEAIKKSGPTK